MLYFQTYWIIENTSWGILQSIQRQRLSQSLWHSGWVPPTGSKFSRIEYHIICLKRFEYIENWSCLIENITPFCDLEKNKKFNFNFDFDFSSSNVYQLLQNKLKIFSGESQISQTIPSAWGKTKNHLLGHRKRGSKNTTLSPRQGGSISKEQISKPRQKIISQNQESGLGLLD